MIVRIRGFLFIVLLIGQMQTWAADGIIFSDDFETGNLDRWDDDTDRNSPQRLKLTNDPAHVMQGQWAVEISIPPTGPRGAKLNKWFLPGYDRVYARWYCRFAEDFDQGNHIHGVAFLANRLDNKWSAYGQAGIRPNGTNFFNTELIPWRDWGRDRPPGALVMNSYHMDGPADRDGYYWGELFKPETKFIPDRGRWYCFEMMIQANTPGQADGEQAFWVDGVLQAEFKGIRFRTTKDLKINDFWILLYVHESAHTNRAWFDDIVVSRYPIGPAPRQTSSVDVLERPNPQF